MNPNFKNCTFFILPIRVNNHKKMISYLDGSEDWNRVEKPFNINYLFEYAVDILDPKKQRLVVYTFNVEHLPNIVKFKNRIEDRLKYPIKEVPSFGEVNLYIFSTGIAFFEIKALYGGMTLDEIVQFIFHFRSLRNDENRKYLKIEEDEVSLEKAINSILPLEEMECILCFSNTSRVKKQCVIFSMIYPGEGELTTPQEMNKYRYWLAHGYNHSFAYVDPAELMKQPYGDSSEYVTLYELLYNVSSESFWGGSQDGLAIITNNPFVYLYNNLCNDYHYMYLLLLNQRFSSLAYIQDLANDSEDIQKIYPKTLALKTSYSFRVISDDRIYQNIYSRLYKILELDELLQDIEETYDQLNQQLEAEQKKREKRTNDLLIGLSVLALFSAWVDLTDFLASFLGRPYFSAFSAILCIIIIIVAVNRNKE